jgi:hypothetical protein
MLDLFLISGHAVEFDDIIIEGSVEDLAFVAYYVKYVISLLTL